MPYDDTTLKRDGSGITPVPQHFNPTINDYEPIYGRNNAGRVEIYGPDGNPISTDDSNKLAVRASEIETILNEIKNKDFATQTTVAAILNKIISAPATEAKQTALNALVGEVQAAPTANTMLARLKSLEDKIDKITAGTTPAVTQLSGSILAEQKTQADAVTNVITFVGDINAIEIYHEESTWQTFTVNGITLTIPAGGYRTPITGVVAKTVTIPAGIDCIVGRLS